MNTFSKFTIPDVVSVALLSAAMIYGQTQTPTPAPAPAPAAPATTPAAPSTPPATTTAPAPAASSNPTVMLLKQGHSENVRAKAAQDLGKAGDVFTIPALADALTDPSAKVRHEVVLALAQFHQPAILPPLEQATKDTDDSVRVTAVQCLVGYYSGVIPTGDLPDS